MKHVERGIKSNLLNGVKLEGTIEEPSVYPLSVIKTYDNLTLKLTILG